MYFYQTKSVNYKKYSQFIEPILQILYKLASQYQLYLLQSLNSKMITAFKSQQKKDINLVQHSHKQKFRKFIMFPSANEVLISFNANTQSINMVNIVALNQQKSNLLSDFEADYNSQNHISAKSKQGFSSQKLSQNQDSLSKFIQILQNEVQNDRKDSRYPSKQQEIISFYINKQNYIQKLKNRKQNLSDYEGYQEYMQEQYQIQRQIDQITNNFSFQEQKQSNNLSKFENKNVIKDKNTQEFENKDMNEEKKRTAQLSLAEVQRQTFGFQVYSFKKVNKIKQKESNKLIEEPNNKENEEILSNKDQQDKNVAQNKQLQKSFFDGNQQFNRNINYQSTQSLKFADEILLKFIQSELVFQLNKLKISQLCKNTNKQQRQQSIKLSLNSDNFSFSQNNKTSSFQKISKSNRISQTNSNKGFVQVEQILFQLINLLQQAQPYEIIKRFEFLIQKLRKQKKNNSKKEKNYQDQFFNSYSPTYNDLSVNLKDKIESEREYEDRYEQKRDKLMQILSLLELKDQRFGEEIIQQDESQQQFYDLIKKQAEQDTLLSINQVSEENQSNQ